MNGLYDIKLKDKEIALSAEELVTMFTCSSKVLGCRYIRH